MKFVMNKWKNYYKILGFGEFDEIGNWSIKKSPTPEEIKLSYRTLSKKYHPDIAGKENINIFEEILEAYKILSNENTKSQWDSKSKFGLNYDSKTELWDFEFSNDSSSISNIKDKYNTFDKNRDIIDIVIDIEEYQETISYDRFIICNTCNGTGLDYDGELLDCEFCETTGEFAGKQCSMCAGNGYISYNKCKKCSGERLIKKKRNSFFKRSTNY
jgi:molecular chaperone DnaJ